MRGVLPVLAGFASSESAPSTLFLRVVLVVHPCSLAEASPLLLVATVLVDLVPVALVER